MELFGADNLVITALTSDQASSSALHTPPATSPKTTPVEDGQLLATSSSPLVVRFRERVSMHLDSATIRNLGMSTPFNLGTT